jgi:hypothetical protein
MSMAVTVIIVHPSFIEVSSLETSIPSVLPLRRCLFNHGPDATQIDQWSQSKALRFLPKK